MEKISFWHFLSKKFQFYLVRLMAQFCQTKKTASWISILPSTINGSSSRRSYIPTWLFQFYLVRLMGRLVTCIITVRKFQFYLVRLMEYWNSYTSATNRISILPSTINGIFWSWCKYSICEFQFYLVRLMGSWRRLIRNPAKISILPSTINGIVLQNRTNFNSIFQFYLVRLMALR